MNESTEERVKKFVNGLKIEHYELLHRYGYADFKLKEEPVEGYEEEELWLSNIYEQALLQLMREERIDELRNWKQDKCICNETDTASCDSVWHHDNEIEFRIAELSEKGRL